MRTITVNDLPTTYTQALFFLRGKEMRNCGYATRVELTHDGIAIRHHYTRIVTFHPDDTATFNSGGYRTVTTKRRFNLVLRDTPWRLWSERGELQWHYHHSNKPRDVVAFEDGDRVFLGRGKGCAIWEAYKP